MDTTANPADSELGNWIQEEVLGKRISLSFCSQYLLAFPPTQEGKVWGLGFHCGRIEHPDLLAHQCCVDRER